MLSESPFCRVYVVEGSGLNWFRSCQESGLMVSDFRFSRVWGSGLKKVYPKPETLKLWV